MEVLKYQEYNINNALTDVCRKNRFVEIRSMKKTIQNLWKLYP